MMLRIDALPWFASSWLIPRLPDFVATHPDIELSVSASWELVDFESSQFDAALRFGSRSWPSVSSDLLFDEWLLPVASPEVLARCKKLGFADLGRWPLVGDPEDRWPEWFARHGGQVPKRFVARFDSSDTMVRGATEGLGLALIPAVLAKPLLKARRLVRVGARRLAAGRSYFLVYPQRTLRHAPFVKFRDWLLQSIAAERKTD
jgi:LysR family glycine cleavage system transcriptional activator